MSKKNWSFLGLLVALLFVSSCEPKIPTGSLMIRAPQSGSFEIYRVAGENPMQFETEQLGHFNKKKELTVGTYLIFADCSHQMIDIFAGQTKHLVSHRVEFKTPIEPSEKDKFSIQCNRFAKTKAIQQSLNRFSLNILHGKRELLVGMVPLKIDFEQMENPRSPKSLSYELAAIKVASAFQDNHATLFFASPTSNLLAITENQKFGHWLYLMPGDYMVTVNGTEQKQSLSAGEVVSIEPAFIQINTNKAMRALSSSNVLGTPLYVELNGQHWLDLNERYPVLPGRLNLKLNGSLRAQTIEIAAGQTVKRNVRSVQVNLDCPPWNWDCLGRRKVYLFEGEDIFPFAQSMTDTPILFFEENVKVSVEGSRDLKYVLNEKKDHQSLKVAFVKFIPKPAYRPNLMTDLARVEAIGPPFEGHTLDLPLDSPVTIPFIEGSFYLSQFTSNFLGEYERQQQKRWIRVKQRQIPEITFRVLVSEKKWKAIQEEERKSPESLKAKKRAETTAKNSPIIPYDIN